jgi:hypothetical protein
MQSYNKFPLVENIFATLTKIHNFYCLKRIFLTINAKSLILTGLFNLRHFVF